ncbi:MAG: hypothetical protein QOE21_1174, partial [Microbacteriaceae bacterium]|nr:hypothetical protein [Microbacteriaceae bacterium]
MINELFGAAEGAAGIERRAPVPMYHQLKRRIVDEIARLGLQP